ncbi:pleckstrin homology-like domain family B member 1 [Trichogramma pretiosum]|uniref:pleckstrin homology-like domain family B member 1 n=1 Tax=Trichogramma pretiosum TaxID=7493 RepID=UPI0006C963E0|nr:pleckstrin homology-like domain family B member 1 [Trichogramma pretiosum]
MAVSSAAAATGIEVRESGRALSFHTEMPHLVSTGSGRLSTTVTLHPLPEGRTLVGQARGSDLQISGQGIDPSHCVIENVAGSVTLHPLKGSTCVDGRAIHDAHRLKQGSVLTLGRSTQFRFNNPVEAQHLKCQQQQQAKGKPPVAPRKSPRSSSASCSSDTDEPVNFLGKLSKFEMLARQTRQQVNNVVSPKVFPPGSLTTSVPADQILPTSVQQQQQQQQQQQYQPYYHNNHAKSASFSTMGRSSPLQNVTNFERCRNEDDARQCKLTNQYNTNHNNSIYQNVDDSNADLMTRSLGRRWQEQIQPYRPQQQQQQYNNHHHHNHHHQNHHQRRAASSQELESTYNDENHNGNGYENVDNGYENGYENVFTGGGGMSTDDIMSRSFHCQRDEDLNQFSRDFDMSQSLIVAKTTTHTEFLKLEQYGSNNGSRYNLQSQQQQQQQPQGQVVVGHRRAGSCDSYNNSAQNIGIPRQKSPKQPSPAYNREVRVPKQQSKHQQQQQHHYQNFFTLPSNKPSEPLYGRIMRPLSPESERDAQERMRRAYEQRMREHGEKVRREKAHLEEMLATCTDYERQTSSNGSSNGSNGKHVEQQQQQPRRKHEEETILLSAVGYQSPHLPYKKPTVGCRNGPRYSGRPKTPPPSEEEQHHQHHHQPPLPPPPPPLPATPESSDNCDDNKLLAATPNNNRAPQWPEQENGYAVVMKPSKQQNKVAACYPADSDNYNHLNDVSPSSSQKFAPTTNETTTHERIMYAEPQIPQQQQSQKKQERNEVAAAPPLPEKTIKLTYHNYENFMPVINGNLSIYENIGASQHSVNGDATTAGNNNVNNNINEAVQSSQQQLVSNNNGGKRSLPRPPKKPARTAPERHNNLLESTKLDVSNDDLLEAIEQLSQLSKPRNSSGSTTTPIADHYQTPVKRLNGDNSKRLNDEYGDRADNNKDDGKADESEKEQQRAQLEDQDRGKYMDFLENEKQHILANMDSFKRSVAEIETQEEEISRELELEKALLSAEHESESLKLEQDEAELNRVQEKLRELEAEMAEDKAGQTQIQAEARQRVLVAQQACASLEEQLAEAEGRDDERDSDLANRLAAQTDQLETERKAFEDLEFHHLEEEASKLANREELQRYAEELRAKVDARRLQLEQLESQRSDIKTTVLKEAKSLERQKLAHLRRLEEGRNRLRTIDDELESLVKNVNDNLVAEKRSPSREDFDRISRVTSESPIVNNNEGSGLARKTIESLKEIERNRQLHLAKQGSQVISEERRRVEELKRRVQEEVRSQWEERKMNCTSLNSVESGEESSSYSTGPTESGSGSSDGADTGATEKLSPGSKLSEFTSSASPGSSGDSYTLLQTDRSREERAAFTEQETYDGNSSSIIDEGGNRPLSQTSSEMDSLGNVHIKLRDNKTKSQRPLTRYLPIKSESLDLRHHIETAGHPLPLIHDIGVDETSCSGYLSKMSKRFHHWNKRWFVFDRKRKTLSYYSDNHSRKPRGVIYFQSIEEVYIDHMNTVKSPHAELTFVVKSSSRVYHLMAPSSEAMRVWVDVIFTGAEGYHEFDPNS